MIEVVILGGGNIGNVRQRLDRAEAEIAKRVGAVTARSDWHTTKAWGFECNNLFTNRAYVVQSSLCATDILEVLLDIEVECGRDRKAEYCQKVLQGESYASRVIDLDILLYGDCVTVTKHLQVPHPRLLERDFAIIPMCQALGITVEEGKKRVRNIIEHEI